MPRLSSRVWVSSFTAGALVVITVLALQAGQAATRPKPAAEARRPSPSVSARPRPRVPALPRRSGTGRRVVYSLGRKRVWLVGAGGHVAGTFPVWPGTLGPAVGLHHVSFRRRATTGSDGAHIENVVYFATSGPASIAFSNAVDGASPHPAPGMATGGIRLHREDGGTLWEFATLSTPVVVVR
jgi:hypothetical protein